MAEPVASNRSFETTTFNTKSIRLLATSSDPLEFYEGAILQLEEEVSIDQEDTPHEMRLIIDYNGQTIAYRRLENTKIENSEILPEVLTLKCVGDPQTTEQPLVMQITFFDHEQCEEARKQLDGDLGGDDPDKTELQFNEKVSESNGNSQMKELLNQACRISECFINTEDAKYVFKQKFCVPLDLFAVKLKQVRIEFKPGKEAPMTQLEQAKKANPPTAWIWRSEPQRILINEDLWNRWTIADKEEKQVILLAVSMCIVHELANCAIQWAPGKHLTKSSSFIKRTPEKYGEAGRYMERQIFGHKIVTVQSQNGKITGVAIDHSDQTRKKGNQDDFTDRYEKISADYIKSVCEATIDKEDLLELSLVGKRGLQPFEFARSALHIEEERIQPHGTPLLPTETVRRTCGVHSEDDYD